MKKDLSRLEKINANKFINPDYLHGFRFGVLEGNEMGYEQGVSDAIDKCAEVISKMNGICHTACPIRCEWDIGQSCKEIWIKYLQGKIDE